MKIYKVDSFTDRPFSGNPAAVCLLGSPRDAGWMQCVAREMNVSETAFVLKNGDEFDLRWFTPTVEVDLCGHATLAAARVLWEEGAREHTEPIEFRTRSGLLVIKKDEDWIQMDFPSELESENTCPPELTTALQIKPVYCGKNRFDYLLELESENMLRNIRPDFELLGTIDIRGVIVTARSSSMGVDFVSRFFAPRVGVNEDPVTGSAHCCLGPFWGRRLGKDDLTGLQVSDRGGLVKVINQGNRVLITGKTALVLKGELLC